MVDLNEKEKIEEQETEVETEETVEEVKEENKEESLELSNEENNEEEQAEETLPEMTPIVEVETLYDYKVLKYCNMYIYRVKRHSSIVSLIMAIVFIAISAIILYTSIVNKNNNYIFGIMTILLAIWVIISIFTEERKIDRSLVNYFKTHAPVKQKFSFDKEKIRITAVVNGEERQADYPWAYVTEIHAVPEYFYLFLNGSAPIVLDRSDDAIVTGTREDLENLIREESALKPCKEYNKPVVKRLVDVTYYVPAVEEAEANEEEKEDKEEKEEDNNQ